MSQLIVNKIVRMGWSVPLILICLMWGGDAYAGGFKGLNKQGIGLYEKGGYDEALVEYNKALTDKPESAIINFNIGSARYKKGQYDEAIKAYSKALISEDRKLEASANYNIANAKFRQGQTKQAADLAGAIAEYKTALDYYKRAMELDPEDKDAKLNHEFVERMLKDLLDKLKKQQEEQKKKQEEQDKQEKKSEGDKSKEGEDKGEKEKAGQKQKDQQQQDVKQNEAEQQKAEQEKAEQEKAEQEKAEQEKAQAAGDGLQKQMPAGEMTKEEANALLEDIRRQEQSDREENKQRRPAGYVGVEKDW